MKNNHDEQTLETLETLFYIEQSRDNLETFCCLLDRNYEPSWHHRIIIKKLEAVERGEIRRLMIFMPPRHGKSMLASIFFPAWFLGRNPKKEIITCSYAQDIAQHFGGKTRAIVAEPLYRQIFGTSLKKDAQAQANWETDKGGNYVSVGIGGALTGRGANCLLLDDPLKNREEANSEVIREKVWDFYTSTAYTRLAPDGAIILIQTRWHLDDLAGRILGNTQEKWEIVNFPAIALENEQYRRKGEALWPTRYNLQDIERIQQEIGPYDFSALYQQAPILSENQEFRVEWFRRCSLEQLKEKKTTNFLTIDTAISQKASADYTGICRNYVDKDNNWHLRAYRLRCNPKELIDLIFTLHDKDNYLTIGIEKTIYFDALKPFFEDEMRVRNKFLPIVPVAHSGKAKEVRIKGLIPRYANRSVYHVVGSCNDLENELLTFPVGITDDVADAVAYQLQIAHFGQGAILTAETGTPSVEWLHPLGYIESRDWRV